MKAAIYCRVSTSTQAEKGYSLPEQDLICAQYILDKQYTFVDRVHEDISGTTYERPQMDRILQMAKNKQIDVLVCMELDRFARGPVPMIIMERQLKEYGVKVEYALNQFDSTPIGEFMKTVAAGIAELERQKILERMTRGKNGKARSGKVVQSPNPPYGYRYANNAYQIDPIEAEVVQSIYRLYVEEHLGYVAIANRLTTQQIPTRSDTEQFAARRSKASGVWNMSTVRNILSNRVYIGELLWGKEEIIIPVPAIIDTQLYQRAQEQKTQNIRFNRRNMTREYLLTGMLYCATCGERFYGLTKGGRPRYYRCGSQVPDHKPYPGYQSTCPTKYVKAEVIEQAVWDAVAEVLKKPEMITLGLREAQEKKAAEAEQAKIKLDALQQQISKIKHQEQKLLDVYLEKGFAIDILKAKGEELRKIRENLEAQLVVEETTEPLSAEDFDKLETYCRKISRGLQKFTLQQKRSTLRLLQIKVVLDKRTGDMVLTGLLGELRASNSNNVQLAAPFRIHFCLDGVQC